MDIKSKDSGSFIHRLIEMLYQQLSMLFELSWSDLENEAQLTIFEGIKCFSKYITDQQNIFQDLDWKKIIPLLFKCLLILTKEVSHEFVPMREIGEIILFISMFYRDSVNIFVSEINKILNQNECKEDTAVFYNAIYKWLSEDVLNSKVLNENSVWNEENLKSFNNRVITKKFLFQQIQNLSKSFLDSS